MQTKDFKTKTIICAKPSKCPKDYWVISLDLGYSSVDGFCPNKYFCFPSYACEVPPNRPSFKESSFSDIRYRDSSGEWVVGELAYDEIGVSKIIEDETELFGQNHYYSPMFKVIARVGLALGLKANNFGSSSNKKVMIQTGLPPKYKADEKYIQDVLAGTHQFEIKIGNGKWEKYSFSIAKENIPKVMPQPLGALISASVDINGKQLPIANDFFSQKKKVVVLDPGFGTMDWYTIVNGSPVDNGGTIANLGMREVFLRTVIEIEKRYHISIPVYELQNYLIDGMIRVMPDKRSMKRKKESFEKILFDASHSTCMDMIEKMLSIHDYFSDTDYIVGTGGTYDAWEKDIKNTFKDMEDLTVVSANVNDPALSNVFSNARGYYYYLVNILFTRGI